MMDFIEVYDDALKPEICQKVRDLFSKPGLAKPGVTGHGSRPIKRLALILC